MRLIDIDPIIEKLKNAIYLGKRIGEDTANLEAVLADIEAQPTAEKKGKWVYDEERGATGIYAICTACEEMIYQTGEFNYCPNCGARMEEE